MLRTIFHKFGSSACTNRDEVLLSDLLFEIVLADDAEHATLYFFQSENLKESVSESTYVEVDPNGLTSKKQNALECGKCRSTF